MKDVHEKVETDQPIRFRVNPDLKSNPNDPYIQKKIARATEILANLKEPLTEERIQMLRQGRVPK